MVFHFSTVYLPISEEKKTITDYEKMTTGSFLLTFENFKLIAYIIINQS